MLNLSLEHALSLDSADPLRGFRDQFHIPKTAAGKDEIYFCGNSLGLQPKRTADYVGELLTDWQNLGVRGHFEPKHAWLPYHEFLTDPMAKLVGAQNNEVVTMNSLTANLHLMMVSFYRPTATRYKILIEDHAFPSDTYAVASQLKLHGHDPREAMLTIKPREGEELIRAEDLYALIEREGESIALILLPGVQYYTGQVMDFAEITRLGHSKGCMVGFDLAHAVGNIELKLHDWDVDFACWCTYKYLNSGPGSVAGCFVHERHATNRDLPRFAGWWGHDKSTRFQMGPDFQAIPTAEGWQLSNPPVLSLAAIRASLDVFTEAGGMRPLREKAEKLTGYLEALLKAECGSHIAIITPESPAERGCQLSLTVASDQMSGKVLHEKMEAAGITCDWREPNVIRVAPTPLYNSYADAWHFVDILKGLL
ncbi:MAG: kynureninase [Gammaproteobacteria bacterium]|nr:kynureninase [Gammaproteobacteria bacterium]